MASPGERVVCPSELAGRNSSGGVLGASLPCNHSKLAAPYSPEATAAFASAIALMVLFTIVGNVLVIIAVLTGRSLRGPQNLFLVSLAAADILVATLIIPFSLANELLGYWYFKSLWCEIYLALDVLFCTASIFHLCAISLDRYLSISRVAYGRRRTPARILTAVAVVWLISAVISFPPLLSSRVAGSEREAEGGERGPQCQLNDERWYILYSTLGSFFAPCLIMILVYVRIYQIAKQRTRRPPGTPRKEGSATPGRPLRRRQAQANGTGDGDSPPPRTPHARPPTLAVTASPSATPASSPPPTPNNLLQPPTPSPAPSPTTTLSPPSSPLGPSPSSLTPSPSSSLPPPAPASIEEEMARGRKSQGPGGKRRADNNNDTSSSESDAERRGGGRGRGGGAAGVGGVGVHSPATIQRYRQMIATATGARLAAGRRSKAEAAPGEARRKAMVNREKRFTFVLAVVIGVFVVCWFPFFFSYSLQAVCPDACALPEPLFKFFFWIGYCNSCLNPVIYTVFNKDFRKAFKTILCKNAKGTFF